MNIHVGEHMLSSRSFGGSTRLIKSLSSTLYSMCFLLTRTLIHYKLATMINKWIHDNDTTIRTAVQKPGTVWWITDSNESLNSYFVATNIGQFADDAAVAVKCEADKKKVGVTISLISKTAYSRLKDLSLPDLPAQKAYDQLTEILKGYYKPNVSKLQNLTSFITPSRVRLKLYMNM